MTELRVGDGAIEYGGLRVCLMDVPGGFLVLRRSMERALGDVAASLLYNAGFASYEAFSADDSGAEVPTGEAAFRAGVAAYRRAGFGGFRVVEVDLGRGRALVECDEPAAFEAYGVLRRGDGEQRAVCDYTRGALAGLFTAATGRADRLCLETECRAKGDARCRFEVGEERALTAKALRER